MKQFIVDSTYKDAVVVDNNEFPTIISNNNITGLYIYKNLSVEKLNKKS